jgi:hypothetical protein
MSTFLENQYARRRSGAQGVGAVVEGDGGGIDVKVGGFVLSNPFQLVIKQRHWDSSIAQRILTHRMRITVKEERASAPLVIACDCPPRRSPHALTTALAPASSARRPP